MLLIAGGGADPNIALLARRAAARGVVHRALIVPNDGEPTRLAWRLKLTHAQRDALVADASGDRLDAVLCLLQAAWGHHQQAQGHPQWGLPAFDPLEGWIVGVDEFFVIKKSR